MTSSSSSSISKQRRKSLLVLSRHTGLGVGLLLLLCAVCPTHPSTASATATPSGLAFVGGAAITARYEWACFNPDASIMFCSAVRPSARELLYDGYAQKCEVMKRLIKEVSSASQTQTRWVRTYKLKQYQVGGYKAGKASSGNNGGQTYPLDGPSPQETHLL